MKRKKNFKWHKKENNKKIDNWESNYYESLKNSSESEFNEEDLYNTHPNKIKKKIRKKNLKMNFKKKILKSEKKSNLVKLNVNLKQMIFDQFENNSKSKFYNNYLNAAKHKTKKISFKICTLCLKRLFQAKCILCRSPLCNECFLIHPEINCEAFG